MKNIFFLPHWYLEKKVSKRNRIIKFCFIFIFIADLILLDISIFRLNKIKSLQNDIKKESISKDKEYLKKDKNQTNNDKTLQSFSSLISSVDSGIDFKYINIQNKSVDIRINNINFDYTLFIKEIEKENMFTIKSLSLSEEKDNQEVKVNLELKQNGN